MKLRGMRLTLPLRPQLLNNTSTESVNLPSILTANMVKGVTISDITESLRPATGMGRAVITYGKSISINSRLCLKAWTNVIIG